MKILVCVKTILHPLLPLRIAGSAEPALAAGEPPVYCLSDGSLTALELAMAVKDASSAQVTVLTVGPEWAQQGLRYALARGADRAVHYLSAQNALLSPQALTDIISGHTVDAIWVLCGDGAAGAFLAEALGWPLVTRVISTELDAYGIRVRAVRRLDRGARALVTTAAPAVLCAAQGEQAGQYVSTMRLQAVESWPVEQTFVPEETIESSLKRVDLELPKPRPRRMAAPSATMTAAQRMNFLMKRGQSDTPAREDRFFEGPPDQAAERILRHLKEQGLL